MTDQQIRKKAYELEVLLPQTNALKMQSVIVSSFIDGYVCSDLPFTDFVDNLILYLHAKNEQQSATIIEFIEKQPIRVIKLDG